MKRPNNCKRCGGKMQQGGSRQWDYYQQQQLEAERQALRKLQMLQQPMLVNETDVMEPPRFPESPIVEKNRVQEMIDKGLLDIPNLEGTTEQQYLNAINEPKDKRKKNPMTSQDIGILMQGIRTGIGEIAGRVERGRQNRYDYLQQTALGMLNPMPVSNFQPNPYSLYAKYGGNLKTIMKDYNKWTNQANMNFGSGDEGKGKMQAGGFPYARKMKNVIVNNYGYQSPQLSSPMDSLTSMIGTQNPDFISVLENMRSKEMGYHMMSDGTMMPDAEMPNREMMKMGGLEHHNYFGPPFSNGAKMDMTDGQRFDRMMIMRKILPNLMRFRGKKEKGGIHIKPENRGKFTDYCGGKVTNECIERGLNSPSAVIRKRANFARNARKWNK